MTRNIKFLLTCQVKKMIAILTKYYVQGTC